MIHHFDHRWTIYASGSADDEESARDCAIAEKQNVRFDPEPATGFPKTSKVTSHLVV